MPELELSVLAKLQDLFSGPANRIRGSLQGLRSDADRLSYALSPLRYRLSSIVSVYAALAISRDSLEQATEQIAAERSLIQALRGRASELTKIKVEVEAIAKKSAIGGDVLLQAASRLVDLNVKFAEIPRFLQIAVDTSAALGKDVDTIVEALGRIQTTGIVPPTLSKQVPELKAVKDGVLTLAEAIDFLEAKFEGRAVGNLRGTFGEIKLSSEAIKDELEKIGFAIAPVSLKFTQLREKFIGLLATFLESPGGKAFIKFTEVALEGLLKILATVSAIGVAVLAVKFVVWVAPIALLLGKFLLMGVVLKGIVDILLSAFGLSDNIRRAWESATTSVSEWATGVADGSIQIEDALGQLRIKLATVTQGFSRLWIVVREEGVAVITALVEGYRGFFSLIELGALKIARDFRNLAREIREFFTGEPAVKTHGPTPFVAEDGTVQFKPVTEEEAKNFGQPIKDALDRQIDEVEDRIKKIGAALLTTSNEATNKRISDAFDKETEELANLIEQENLAVETRRSKRIQDARDTEKAIVTDTLAQEKVLADEIAALEKQLADIRVGINRDAQEAIGETRRKELAALFEQDAIGAVQFIEEVSSLILDQRQKELAIVNEQARAQELAIAQRRIEEGPLADVRAELNALIDLRIREQQIAIDLRNQELELDQVRGTITQKIVQDAEKAKQAYDDAISRAEDLRSSGTISTAVAAERQAQALTTFGAKIAVVKSDLADLEVLPGFEDELRKAREELEKITDLGTKLAETDFSSGFIAGIRQATASVQNLRDIGLDAGRSLTEAFADGLTQAFLKADGGFKAFATNFLRLVSEMIIRVTLLRLISAAIGGLGGGGAPVGAGGASTGIVLAEGGPVPGPDVRRDVVPATLMPNEWVIKRSSALYYGNAIMAAINHGLIPRDALARFAHGPMSFGFGRFAEGGQASAGRAGPVRAYVIADDVTLDRLLKGGRRAERRYRASEDHDA